jgi:hypothetical protein
MNRWRKLSIALALCGVTAVGTAAEERGAAQPQTRIGSPIADVRLPPGTEWLTRFGVQPQISLDGREVAFIGAMFGDAFEIDLATREVRNLTAHFPHAGFIRVFYLANGDYLLTGPRRFNNEKTSRYFESELWVLRRDARTAAVPLGQIAIESVAVSRQSMKIAWLERPDWSLSSFVDGVYTLPDFKPTETSYFSMGEIVYDEDGTPRLVDRRLVLEFPRSECWGEPTDFRHDDREVLYACLRQTSGPWYWATKGVNVDSGEVTTYHYNADAGWEELEGLAPDQSWAVLECGPGISPSGQNVIDLCRVELDPQNASQQKMTRLTFFNEQGANASNGVVSPDGRSMIFMIVTDRSRPMGTGDGLLLMQLPQ